MDINIICEPVENNALWITDIINGATHEAIRRGLNIIVSTDGKISKQIKHQSESGKLHDICSNVKAKPEGTGGREGVVIDQADDNECHKAYISKQSQLKASIQPKWSFPFHNVRPPAVLFLQTAPHRSCTVLLSV